MYKRNISPHIKHKTEMNKEVVIGVKLIFTASDSGLSVLKSKKRLNGKNGHKQ